MGMIAEREYWWFDHTELAALYQWLNDMSKAPNVVDFLRKPWEWNAEHDRMLGKVSVAVNE